MRKTSPKLLITLALAVISLFGSIIIMDRYSKDARATVENTLQCNPVSSNTSYSLPAETKWVLKETSVIDQTTWAGTAVNRDIVTENGHQVSVYYDADRRIVAAHRPVASKEWTTYRITGTDAVTDWDTHKYVTAAIDSQGYIHVAGNMHNQPMRYWRSAKPYDVTTLQQTKMVGDRVETSVTYPVFYKNADKKLLFTFRNGVSGSGASTYINLYDPVAKIWHRPGGGKPLFNGQPAGGSRTDGWSSYFKISQDANGFYRMVWMWRQSDDASTNSRLSYAESTDLVNWRNVWKQPVKLPITPETGTGTIVDDIKINNAFDITSVNLGKDAKGKLTIAYSKFGKNNKDQQSNQLFMARPEDAGWWHVYQITSTWNGKYYKYGTGTVSGSYPTPSGTQPLPDGRLRMDYACPYRTTVKDAAGKDVVTDAMKNGTLILGLVDNDTSGPLNPKVFADIARPGSYLPAAVGDLTATEPATKRASATDRVNDNCEYILKWQARPISGDGAPTGAEATPPPPQPAKVFTVQNPSAPANACQ